MTLDKFAIAERLRRIGSLLELKGENPFRARAYANGAEALTLDRLKQQWDEIAAM